MIVPEMTPNLGGQPLKKYQDDMWSPIDCVATGTKSHELWNNSSFFSMPHPDISNYNSAPLESELPRTFLSGVHDGPCKLNEEQNVVETCGQETNHELWLTRNMYMETSGTPLQIDGPGEQATEEEPESNTSIMLKGLPCRCSHKDIMDALEDLGFGGRYDFVHLPRKNNQASNLGYAFIGFETEDTCRQFTDAIIGYHFAKHRSTKVLETAPAHIQGIEKNLARFHRSSSSATVIAM
jgi:hypothetical protein